MMSPAQRDAVVVEAQRWLRTPWHHGARVLGGGVDCAQLLAGVYVGAGIVPSEAVQIEPYPHDWMMHRDVERFLGVLLEHCVQVVRPQRGDIAVWRYGRTFSHGAIVIDWPQIIHAYLPEGMVCWGRGDLGALALMAGARARPVQFYTPKVEP